MQEYIDFFSNNLVLVLAWIATAGFLAFSILQGKLNKVSSVSAQEAITLINKQNALVVDIRSQDEYKKGHIVNSKNITQSQITDGKFSEIENHKDMPIILVCETGHRSSGAGGKLSKAGFTQVYNLLAGMSGWQSENFPTTKK